MVDESRVTVTARCESTASSSTLFPPRDPLSGVAGFHPQAKAGSFGPKSVRKLHATLREVCAEAMDVIGKDWSDPPDTWLFNHRWKDGGRCPRSKKPLVREEVSGRTTCWSPERQVLGAERR